MDLKVKPIPFLDYAVCLSENAIKYPIWQSYTYRQKDKDKEADNSREGQLIVATGGNEIIAFSQP